MTLVKYLGDWENPFPARVDMPSVCGISLATLYRHFSPAELQIIENEGLELRKKNSARPRAKIYEAMELAAKSGDVAAMKEYLNRTEGKVPDKLNADITSKKIIIRRRTRDGEE